MKFRIHHYPRPTPGRFFFQWMNWHWRGVIVRINDRQYDLFWREQYPGIPED